MNLEISSSSEVYETPADIGHLRNNDLLLLSACLLMWIQFPLRNQNKIRSPNICMVPSNRLRNKLNANK